MKHLITIIILLIFYQQVEAQLIWVPINGNERNLTLIESQCRDKMISAVAAATEGSKASGSSLLGSLGLLYDRLVKNQELLRMLTDLQRFYSKVTTLVANTSRIDDIIALKQEILLNRLEIERLLQDDFYKDKIELQKQIRVELKYNLEGTIDALIFIVDNLKKNDVFTLNALERISLAEEIFYTVFEVKTNSLAIKKLLELYKNKKERLKDLRKELDKIL